MNNTEVVQLWTDGACNGNPGPGGWAAIAVYPDGTRETFYGKSEGETTNNKMELYPLVKCLAVIALTTSYRSIEIHSDSKYIVEGISGKWKIKTNLDLWSLVSNIIQKAQLNVTAVWVKGHSGVELNEECNRLANEQAGITEEENHQVTRLKWKNVWKNQTELAEVHGSTAVDIGRFLIEIGWRDPVTKGATEYAVVNGLAKPVQTNKGYTFARWNSEKFEEEVRKSNAELAKYNPPIPTDEQIHAATTA